MDNTENTENETDESSDPSFLQSAASTFLTSATIAGGAAAGYYAVTAGRDWIRHTRDRLASRKLDKLHKHAQESN